MAVALRLAPFFERLLQLFDMIFSGRAEDIDPFESGLGLAAMRNIGRMDAHIAGFHQEGFIAAYVFFFAFQHNKDLLGFMAVDGKYTAGRIFYEADEHLIAEKQIRHGRQLLITG
jgi:hypothetical protein